MKKNLPLLIGINQLESRHCKNLTSVKNIIISDACRLFDLEKVPIIFELFHHSCNIIPLPE